jgi:hypothetical protein
LLEEASLEGRTRVEFLLASCGGAASCLFPYQEAFQVEASSLAAYPVDRAFQETLGGAFQASHCPEKQAAFSTDAKSAIFGVLFGVEYNSLPHAGI